MKKRWFFCLVVLCSPAGVDFELAAAGLDDTALVCDSASDRVMALRDLDKSGFVEMDVPGEVVVFLDDTSPGPDLSTPSHLARGPGGSAVLLDSGTLDALLGLTDKNGDGDANDEGEVWTFYDASAGGPKLSTANTIVAAPDGSYYLSDDGSGAKRILRLFDTNNDGDALDAGEVEIVYNATALSVPVLGDIEAMALTASGDLFVGDTTLQAVFRLHDANGDGDFLDEGELLLFFQSPPEAPLTDIDAILVVDAAILVADSDTGRILRLLDRNADGDANDEDEALPYLDSTSAIPVRSVNDFTAVPGVGFLALDNSRDAVVVLTDRNQDDDVLDAEEIYLWLKDDGSTFATPSGLVLLPRRDDPPPPPQVRFVRGDSTADGKLDISDPVATLGYLFLGRAIAACIDALDADDTGVVNISDPIYLLNYLFSGGAAPLPPFPDAGIDSSNDTLTCVP